MGRYMEYIVNGKEMKAFDRNTIEHFHVPSLVLMERAALAVVNLIETRELDCTRVLILCGSGNNGADGLAVARLLHLKNLSVEVLLTGEKSHFTPEMKQQHEIAVQYEIPFVKNLEACEDRYSLIVDALLGVGLSGRVKPPQEAVLKKINQFHGIKVAVDIPSGISADHGSLPGEVFRADFTVTFAYKKLGMLLYPAADVCGEIVVADIGIDRRSWLERKPFLCHLTRKDLAFLADRPKDANKGSFGRILLIAGGINMAGAAVLAARAAYRTGCGLVRIYTPEENRQIIQTAVPEAILTSYSVKKPDLNVMNECLSWADVIVVGPGLGTDETAQHILKNTLKNAAVPMVVDADALNIISGQVEVLLNPHTELIVTPHLGEMARLSGLAVSYIKENIVQTAEYFARTYNVLCVLKDSRTVVSVPFGRTYLNLSGNSGMATAGSGDVLSGIIGSLLAQGYAAEQAAAGGVFLHGLAGDCAATAKGQHSVMAGDIVERIPDVFQIIRQEWKEEK